MERLQDEKQKEEREQGRKTSIYKCCGGKLEKEE